MVVGDADRAHDLPDRPWVGGAFRWRLGLRPLDPADWIERGPDHAERMAVKAEVLAHHHDTAVVVADDVADESTEVLDALVDHLDRRFPTHAARPDPRLHRLDAAGRLVQEDLVLLVERRGRLVVGGGSVCFPNRWDLRSKLGRTVAEVHAPVPRLNGQLGERIDSVLARLRPDRGLWRLGWGVLDTDALYQPVDGTAAPRPSDRAGGIDRLTADDIHLRVERETLRRFPRTGCVLFTIRTRVAPLATLLADPADAARLAEAVAELPDDVAAYKQLDDLGQRIVAETRRALRL